MRYVSSAKAEFEDYSVFIHGRIAPRKPQADLPWVTVSYRHPSDKPAWGDHHRPMNTKHLNRALQVISHRLGLAKVVTSRTFRTSYAFKVMIDGNVPAWRLASRMGHFSGNKDLARKVCAPTLGPEDTRRTSADGSATVSTGVQRASDANGTVSHLPDPAKVDPELLERADSLLQAFHQHLDEQCGGSRIEVPSDVVDGIIDTFCAVNNGSKMPLKESLAGLLSLTSARLLPWTSVVRQIHPFDDDQIRQGSDATLLDWILRGASHLCP